MREEGVGLVEEEERKARLPTQPPHTFLCGNDILEKKSAEATPRKPNRGG